MNHQRKRTKSAVMITTIALLWILFSNKCLAAGDSSLWEAVVEPFSSFCDADNHKNQSFIFDEQCEYFDPRNHWSHFAYNTGPPVEAVRLPGEFEPVDKLYLAWSSEWSFFQQFYVEIIHAAYLQVPEIVVFVQANTTQKDFESLVFGLYDAGVDARELSFYHVPLNSIWIRDYGPLFVQNGQGQMSIIDMRYLDIRLEDDLLPTSMGEWWNISVSRLPLELEGGNLLSDGTGNCLTTDLIIEKNQHNGFDEALIRDVLKEYFGCQQTYILPRLEGEQTGHVDMFATFAGPKEIILGEYKGEDDPENAAILDHVAARLLRDGFEVHRIPMPGNWDGAFRSYTNALVVGEVLLFPTYSDDTRYEAEAVSIFQQVYPNRRVARVNTTDVIQFAGGIHCATMSSQI